MLLYKYCRQGGVAALRSGKIFLSRPRAFNDPFEMSPHISTFEDPAEMDADLWQRTKQYVILSLAENRESLLMWAHYTERHRGFLIAFDDADGDILAVDSQHRDFGPVSYCHHRPSHNKIQAVTNQELFYTKNSEWAYEREWRIIDSLFSADGDAEDQPSRDCWPFRFRPEAVKEVIMGHRSGAIIGDVCAVLSEPRYAHVKLFLAAPDAKRFHLNFNELPRGGWVPAIPEEDHDPD
jgi:hypothetical protein